MKHINNPIRLDGRHWETGSIQNALALQGAVAPHTGEPYSEALLLGVSGGITFGYFTFEYEGYLPHVVFLTRNTFDPFPTILERLGIVQDVRQTNKAEIGDNNLKESLDSGLYPLVWVDSFSLSYNGSESSETNWNMMPIVTIGMDGNVVEVADRSSRPLHVSMEELRQARGRIKKDKYRSITFDAPQPAKLAAAVSKGIYQCIQLFTEKPPKGARNNFGFAAYQKLADMLVNTRNKQSWVRLFGTGERLYHALAGSVVQPGAYTWIQTWGAGPGAERGLYGDFLDGAADILHKPGLKECAEGFRESYTIWTELAQALLPDEVPLLAESKKLIQRKYDLFLEEGQAALGEIKLMDVRFKELISQVESEFPLSQAEIGSLLSHIKGLILKISEIEGQAVENLQLAIM